MSSPQKPQTNPTGHGRVTTCERAERFGHGGCVIWLTGLSGAGKSTIAAALERRLFNLGKNVCGLDGDDVRSGLNSDLGYGPADRHENIRRVSELAKLRADLAFIVIMAFISPYRADRDSLRAKLRPGEFVEVFVNAPIEVCEQRDVKGLYAKARAGLIRDFTGVSAPYEVPLKPEVELYTDKTSAIECVDTLVKYLQDHKVI